ncbi:MAG: HlyD family efflux transporter periplasmic adaptor subunit [Planctomycetales bacterium]|nr:HlyD family efflux transporter periplasmic adaptor subunit [Planctomycetales bacterium]
MLKMIGRLIIWSLLVIGLASAVYLALRPQPVLIDTAIVNNGRLTVSVNEDGVTRIKERYIVSTPLTGQLGRVQLEVGDVVTANVTTLATLQATDPSLLDPRAVAQAEARVHAAERRLDATESELESSRTALEYAERELARLRSLVTSQAISASELEQHELEVRLRTETLHTANIRVDIANYELELERSALLLTSPPQNSPGENTSMELEIKAPIDGRVLRVYRESAAVLNAGESILEIGDPTDLEAVIDVLSNDAVRIAPGAEVWFDHWGGSERLQGEVRVVEPSGFTKFSALGVEEQRVNVIVDFRGSKEAREQLGDGFRVEARIVVSDSPDTLKLPTSALFRVESMWHVFVVRDQKAVLIPVEVGSSNDLEAEVLSGIEPDAEVIIHPSDMIRDGSWVSRR